jgi:cytochrome c
MTPRLYRWMACGLLAGAAACSRDVDGASRSWVLATTRGDPDAGELAIWKHGCGSCHVIPGAYRARGTVGPPLTDFARRTYIAGNLYNTAENLVAWIRDPDSVEPGTVMPTLGVSEQEARDISAYLYLETGTGGLGPPRLLPASLLRPE